MYWRIRIALPWHFSRPICCNAQSFSRHYYNQPCRVAACRGLPSMCAFWLCLVAEPAFWGCVKLMQGHRFAMSSLPRMAETAGLTCQRHVPTYCQRHVPTWDICQMSGNDPCARMAFGTRSASNPILGRAKRLCRLPLYFTLTKKFPRTLCAFPIKFREKPCALLVLNVKVI